MASATAAAVECQRRRLVFRLNTGGEGQHHLEPGLGPVDAQCDRVDGAPEYRRHLRVAEPVPCDQLQRLPVGRPELLKRRADGEPRSLIAAADAAGRGVGVQQRVEPELAHPPPPVAEHHLAGDPVQPQPVLRRRRNGVRPAQRYDEHLGHQIGHSVEIIAGPSQHVAEYGPVVITVKSLNTIATAIGSRRHAEYMAGRDEILSAPGGLFRGASGPGRSPAAFTSSSSSSTRYPASSSRSGTSSRQDSSPKCSCPR